MSIKDLKNILVIEDSEPDQFINKAILKRSVPDVSILQAYDGVEALALLEKEQTVPDLILLDINMPRMNGHEFLKEYTEKFNRTPPVIIMLTSSDQERDRSETMKYDCVKDYFLKPLKSDCLEKFFDGKESTLATNT